MVFSGQQSASNDRSQQLNKISAFSLLVCLLLYVTANRKASVAFCHHKTITALTILTKQVQGNTQGKYRAKASSIYVNPHQKLKEASIASSITQINNEITYARKIHIQEAFHETVNETSQYQSQAYSEAIS